MWHNLFTPQSAPLNPFNPISRRPPSALPLQVMLSTDKHHSKPTPKAGKHRDNLKGLTGAPSVTGLVATHRFVEHKNMEKRFAAPRCSFLRTERAEAIMTARLPRLNQFIVDHKASTSTAEEALQYREARFFSVDWTTVYGPETCSAYSREIKDFKKLIFAYKSQPRFHDSEADVAESVLLIVLIPVVEVVNALLGDNCAFRVMISTQFTTTAGKS